MDMYTYIYIYNPELMATFDYTDDTGNRCAPHSRSLSLYLFMFVYIYIYIYICVCVCVCVYIYV